MKHLMNNEVMHSLHQVVTIGYVFFLKKYAFRHNVAFDAFFQLYLQGNTPGNDVTS